MIPRTLRRLLLLSILAASTAHAAPVTVTPVFTGWREAASFKRISEYFSGKENTGGHLILRTHPDQRGGYYFQMRLTTAASTESKITLQVITPANATPKVFEFGAALAAPKTMLNLGLTGPDWPDAKINPVAWKLEVRAEDGTLLGSEQSYLWDKPAGK